MSGTKREKEEQLALANALSRVMLSYSKAEDIADACTRELKKYLSIDWGAIAHIEGNLVHLTPLSGKIGPGDAGDVFPLAGTPIAWVRENKRAFLDPDLKKGSKFKDSEFCTRLEQQGLRSVVYMPFFSGGIIRGNLIIGSKEPRAYADRELKLIKYATTQLATVLERSRLAEESEQLREALNWFQAIFHYTKTPLTPIVSSSELLTQEIRGQGKSPLLPLAQNTQQAAQKLAQNLKLFETITQIELSQTRLNLDTSSPQEILTEAASYAHAIAASNTHSFTLELPPELPPIRADHEKLAQVLHILLDNAFRRTRDGGKIELHASIDRDKLIIEVTDSGPALSPQEKADLHRPFQPSQTDSLSSPELSLALAICRRIVELHGGRLWLESEPDRETRFAFSLPLAPQGQVTR